jgi:hypothetical protein
MANGYPFGKVWDCTQGCTSTDATLHFRIKKTGQLVRTLYLSKSSGESFWPYSTAITGPQTYNVTATDTSVQPPVQQTKEVFVPAGAPVETNFELCGMPADRFPPDAQHHAKVKDDFDKAHKKLKDDHEAPAGKFKKILIRCFDVEEL